jgi:hypothetical protein
LGSSATTSTYASTYRSVKHSFNSSLPQEVVLKYTQYCCVIAVDRRFCMGFKGPKGRQHKSWEALTFGAPHEHVTHHRQRLQVLPLGKALFMQDRAINAVRQLYRGLRQLVCLRAIMRFMQIRNHTRGQFTPRFRLPEEQRISFI